LPALLKHIHFSATTAGKPVVEALTYLKEHYHKRQFDKTVPLNVVNKTWHQELDHTYRIVAARLPNNHALRFEGDPGKEELILNPLEKNEEPKSFLRC
jgi:hypothetical protein